MNIDFWTVIGCSLALLIIWKILPILKKGWQKVFRKKHPPTTTGSDHDHGDHAHPEGFALLWQGVKKTTVAKIFTAVLTIYLAGLAWQSFTSPPKPPVSADYMQYDIIEKNITLGFVNKHEVTAFGPTLYRFDSIYNNGLFYSFDPQTKEGTCGYYGVGKPPGKIRVISIIKPSPTSFLVLLQRQKEGSQTEWEDIRIEGKGSL